MAQVFLKKLKKYLMLNSKLKIIFEESFYALTVSLGVFNILELIKPRIVLAYFNLNWLLLGWVIIGIILLVFSKENKE